MDYLRARSISEEEIRRYRLGYTRVARISESPSEDYKQLKEGSYGFRGLQSKIIFPLRNLLGHVNGLTVRDIDKKRYTHYFLGEAKQTGTFFGLWEALPYIASTKKVFVHEGAFNAISFARVLPNSLSSLTSFLNEQQFETLSFFADKIILVYDRDKSGERGVSKLRSLYGDRYIDYIHLGDMDANECLQLMGPGRFESYVRSKVPVMYRS